ncbi:MAG TPA: hypothetical protein VFJ51_08000 [Nitrososphaeraceae archaeon]|nr:hypothetical protein [Nitrososphaeraceae archaeon]
MNDKARPLIAISILVQFIIAAVVISTTLHIALAHDQNAPTTGKATPNVTSTFGPNLPTTSSSSAGNKTSNEIGNITK